MMNKLGLVLGVAAVATLAGCKDPNYVGKNGRAPQDEVKDVQTETKVTPEKTAPVTVAVTDENGKPLDNVKTDVKVEVVEIADVKPAPVAKPAESDFTWYVVRRGDYLAKISKKYNVTIGSIKRLNPQMKGDTVCIGQKIKLPGKVDVEAAPVEEPKAAAATSTKVAKKGASAYTGATVDYVVKNGDTLGGVAYGHGINIRQLKQLNNLSSDSLKIGQKLKVPADGKPASKAAKKAEPAKVAPAKAEAAPAATAEPAKTEAAPVAPAAAEPAKEGAAPATPAAAAEPASDAAAAAAAKDAATKDAAPKAAPAVKTYVVQEGEDMAAISVAWGVTASQIRELNNLGENDQLKPGQTIRLPAEADQQ